MSRNYKTLNELSISRDDLIRWADSHETSIPVALAIHAIADDTRAPEEIWEVPTSAEFDHVVMAVADYIYHGDFDAEDSYCWGEMTITI